MRGYFAITPSQPASHTFEDVAASAVGTPGSTGCATHDVPSHASTPASPTAHASLLDSAITFDTSLPFTAGR